VTTGAPWQPPGSSESEPQESAPARPEASKTPPPPPVAQRPAQDRSVATSWWEDPHFSLDRLTPGQRYTLALAIILIVLLLKFGLPHATPVSPVTPTTPAGAVVRSHTPGAAETP
jgi:hypothetical protein